MKVVRCFLSLGGGVQSTTLLLMALDGELERPDATWFADTGDEPAGVYAHLEWVSEICRQRGMPFHRVANPAGKLSEMLLRRCTPRDDSKSRLTTIPSYGDRGGMGRRQCTREMKIDVLAKAYRRKLGVRRMPRGTLVEVWLGISLDEAYRMKPSRLKWQRNRWPLIEKRMTRHDCVQWLRRHNYPVPPKSACIFCPYHSDAYWREMKLHRPGEWESAVGIDQELNKLGEYLHRSVKPLDSVELSTAEDYGQLELAFGNECEGHCGV